MDFVNLKVLSENLEKTFSATNNEEKKIAESYVTSLESDTRYLNLLIQIINSNELSLQVRIAAAARFKNFIKLFWHEISDCGSRISEEQRVSIKEDIVKLIIYCAIKDVQDYLAETVAIIEKYETLSDDWPQLIPILADKLTDLSNLSSVYGVLQISASIFKKYPSEFRSDTLWKEIAYVLKIYAQPFTTASEAIASQFLQLHDNTNIKIYYKLVKKILKIFYYLNFQEMPEHFEDNIDLWMKIHQTMLFFTKEEPFDDDVPGPLEKIKSQVCENIALYASKYDDEDSPFKHYLPEFARNIWKILINNDVRHRFDNFICKAMNLLSSIASRGNTSIYFKDPSTLKALCEEIIIPNIKLRERDIMNFEMECEDYIRYDIEESDHETRRRAACDLIRALRSNFQKEVSELFSGIVSNLLSTTQNNPQSWIAKDTAIFLVISLAVTGSLEKYGTTKTNAFIDINSFFNNNVVTELTTNYGQHPILLSGCVKFIVMFRNQLPKETLISLLPVLQKYLNSDSIVLVSYSAICIERILFPRMILNNEKREIIKIEKEDIRQYTPELLSSLFRCLERKDLEHNQYVMKAIMRLISVSQSDTAPLIENVFDKLCNRLLIVAKNPKTPDFNHYLFETISAAIKYSCEKNPTHFFLFEEKLFPIFNWILDKEVEEFTPYTYQLIGQLFDLNSELTERYKTMFPIFLKSSLWEKLGLVPALTRILQSYLIKDGLSICSKEQTLLLILGTFQKLISSKITDHYGFQLLDTLVSFVPLTLYQNMIKPIFLAIFKRLSLAKTLKFIGCVLVYISILSKKSSVDFVINIIEEIQFGLFRMVLDSLYLSAKCIQKVFERKALIIGMVKLLTESSLLITTYKEKWNPLYSELLSLVKTPTNINEDINEGDEMNYNVKFVKLSFSGGYENVDFFTEISSAEQYAEERLNYFLTSNPHISSLL